jgi:hypothetical protein
MEVSHATLELKPKLSDIIRRHLWEDLAPFICLYDNCMAAETTYTSQHSWLQHIRTAHLPLVWLCGRCYQEPRRFDSQSSFQQHMRKDHDSSLSNMELELLSRSCRQSLSFDACLICGLEDGMVSIEASSRQPTTDKQHNLITCMINHLEVLALGSLPWHFGCEEDADSDQAEGTKGDTGDPEGGLIDPSPTNEPDEAIGTHQFTFDAITSLSKSHSPTTHRNPIEAWRIDDDDLCDPNATEALSSVKASPPDLQVRSHRMSPYGSPQARPSNREPTHSPAVEAFYAWIKNPRVAIDLDNDLDDFIPAGEVEAYFREDPPRLVAILTALFGSEDARWRGRAREIATRYSVVFAILISIGHGEYILNFLPHESLCDKKLPFETRPTKFPWAPSDSVELFDRFQEAQSRFCAVKFERNTTPEFDDSQPMPYLSKELLDEGGSAKVYKVQIHASHDLLQGSVDNVSLGSAISNLDGVSKC